MMYIKISMRTVYTQQQNKTIFKFKQKTNKKNYFKKFKLTTSTINYREAIHIISWLKIEKIKVSVIEILHVQCSNGHFLSNSFRFGNHLRLLIYYIWLVFFYQKLTIRGLPLPNPSKFSEFPPSCDFLVCCSCLFFIIWLVVDTQHTSLHIYTIWQQVQFHHPFAQIHLSIIQSCDSKWL